jgi:hypothetical protein
MRWLIIFVTAFVLLFGGGIGMAEDDVPNSILDGIMSELVETKTYKGDVINHTFFKVDYAIFSLVDHKITDPVIMGELTSGEKHDIELEAGDYVFMAFATVNGEVKAHYEYKFRIKDGGTDDYGFDIRSGKPPVTL